MATPRFLGPHASPTETRLPPRIVDEDEVTERAVPLAVTRGRRVPPRMRRAESRVAPTRVVVEDEDDWNTRGPSIATPSNREHHGPPPTDNDNVRGPRIDKPVVRAEDDTERGAPIARSEAPVEVQSFASFKEAFLAARAAAQNDAREMLDANDAPVEANEMLAQLEGELGDEQEALAATFTKLRVRLAEQGIRSLRDVMYVVRDGVPEMAKTGFALIDMDTRVKAYKALLEIVPATSFWYAVTGKKLVIPNDTSHPQPEFRDIAMAERAMYAAGSVLFLGEIFNGIRYELARKGALSAGRQQGMAAQAKAVFGELAKLLAPTVGRAQRYGVTQLTKDRK